MLCHIIFLFSEICLTIKNYLDGPYLAVNSPLYPPPFLFLRFPLPHLLVLVNLVSQYLPLFLPSLLCLRVPPPHPPFPSRWANLLYSLSFPWKLTTPPPLFPPVSLPSWFRSPYTLSPIPVRAYYPPPFSLLLSLPSLSQSRSGVLLGGQCLSYWLPPWWSCKTLLWHHCFPTAS